MPWPIRSCWPCNLELLQAVVKRAGINSQPIGRILPALDLPAALIENLKNVGAFEVSEALGVQWGILVDSLSPKGLVEFQFLIRSLGSVVPHHVGKRRCGPSLTERRKPTGR